MGTSPSYMMMANQRQIALARHEADTIPVHQPNPVANREDNDEHSVTRNPQSEEHSQEQPQEQPRELPQEQPTSSSSSSSCPAPLHKHSRKESLSEKGQAAIDKKYEAKRAEAASWHYAHCDRLEQNECGNRERREQQQRIDGKYQRKLEKIKKKHNKALEKVDEKNMKLEEKKSRSRASSSANSKLSRKYSTGETLDSIPRARTDDADEKQPRRKSFKDRLRALSSPSFHHAPVGPPSRPLATGGGAPTMVGVGLGGV
ncbi:hypothetical protein LTR05_008088 [Lithohypha guttulata]|uniref:Uncharacterized protein n=1 Tax=Lithohypha guttulata TaxID=1690604 RepID=A0AAN7STS2_9EURO|nr:hypothetical protein LTR05_008088 [Lithohypha guttulata]